MMKSAKCLDGFEELGTSSPDDVRCVLLASRGYIKVDEAYPRQERS